MAIAPVQPSMMAAPILNNTFRVEYDYGPHRVRGKVRTVIICEPWLQHQVISRCIVEQADFGIQLELDGIHITVDNGWAHYQLSGLADADAFELELIDSEYEARG